MRASLPDKLFVLGASAILIARWTSSWGKRPTPAFRGSYRAVAGGRRAASPGRRQGHTRCALRPHVGPLWPGRDLGRARSRRPPEPRPVAAGVVPGGRSGPRAVASGLLFFFLGGGEVGPPHQFSSCYLWIELETKRSDPCSGEPGAGAIEGRIRLAVSVDLPRMGADSARCWRAIWPGRTASRASAGPIELQQERAARAVPVEVGRRAPASGSIIASASAGPRPCSPPPPVKLPPPGDGVT